MLLNFSSLIKAKLFWQNLLNLSITIQLGHYNKDLSTGYLSLSVKNQITVMKLIKDLYITFICTILVNRHTLSAYVLQAVFSPNHLMEYRVLVHFGRWVHHLFSTEETGVCVNTFLTTIVTLITPHQYCNTDSDVTGGE